MHATILGKSVCRLMWFQIRHGPEVIFATILGKNLSTFFVP
jgi:hypothetical protein